MGENVQVNGYAPEYVLCVCISLRILLCCFQILNNNYL